MTFSLKWLPRIQRFNYVAYIVFQDCMYSTVFTTLLISAVYVKSMITYMYSTNTAEVAMQSLYLVSIW